jgi:hypothetical protein
MGAHTYTGTCEKGYHGVVLLPARFACYLQNTVSVQKQRITEIEMKRHNKRIRNGANVQGRKLSLKRIFNVLGRYFDIADSDEGRAKTAFEIY